MVTAPQPTNHPPLQAVSSTDDRQAATSEKPILSNVEVHSVSGSLRFPCHGHAELLLNGGYYPEHTFLQ